MKYLDKEEKELMESVERGEWKSVKNFESEKKKYMAIAKATIKKDPRIKRHLAKKEV